MGPDSRTVTFGDIATVERGWREPPREIAFSDGRRSVFVGARVDKTYRVDQWASAAREAVAQFDAGLDPRRPEPVDHVAADVAVARQGVGAGHHEQGALAHLVHQQSEQRCREHGGDGQHAVDLAGGLPLVNGDTAMTLEAVDDPTDGGVVTVVAEGIVVLQFEYLIGEEWVADWPPDEQRVPEAVRVVVGAVNSDRDERRENRRPELTVLTTVVPISVKSCS